MPKKVPFDPEQHEPVHVRRDLEALRDAFPEAEPRSSAQSKRPGGEITLVFSNGITAYASLPGGFRRKNDVCWRLEVDGEESSPRNH